MSQQLLRFDDAVVAGEALAAARKEFAGLEGGRITSYAQFVACAALVTEPIVDYGMDPVVAAAHVRMEELGFPLRFTPERRLELLLHAATLLVGRGAGRSSPGIDARLTGLMERAVAARRERQSEGDATYERVRHLIPPGCSLMEHQREALRLIQERGYRCVVHDDQGLGKTVQILCALLVRSLDRPVFPILLVSPASVTGVWEEHATRWLGALTPTIVPLQDWEAGGQQPDRLCVVASYARMAERSGELARVGFRTTVFDESHYLAGRRTRRSLAAILVRGRAENVLCATGTMEPNGRPSETWIQFKLVDGDSPDLLPRRFTYRYCGGRKMKIGSKTITVDDGCSRPVEFGRLMTRYSFRRTKAELGDRLPAKIWYRIPVRLTIRQRLEIAKLKDQVRAELAARAEEVRSQACDLPAGSQSRTTAEQLADAVEGSSAIAEMGRMRRFVGLSKVDHVVGRCVELLQDGHRVILFAFFREVQEALFERLSAAAGGWVVLSGSSDLSAKKRTELVERANREAHAVVLTYAYCEGITLTAFDVVGIVERHWMPDKEKQAADRSHRVGQTRTVSVEVFVAPGTIDDAMAEIHGMKEDNSGQAVGSAHRRVFQWLLADDPVDG